MVRRHYFPGRPLRKGRHGMRAMRVCYATCKGRVRHGQNRTIIADEAEEYHLRAIAQQLLPLESAV
jgi:hypothetical protein